MLRRVFNALYDKLLSRLGLALLALALLVNIGALLAVDTGVRRVEEAAKLVVVSRNVTTEILAIQSMLYEAESAQRGFLYTQNDAYLQPLYENEGQITSRFVKLRGMLADNAAQQKRLDQMRKIAMEKLVDLNKTIAVQKMGQKDTGSAGSSRANSVACGNPVGDSLGICGHPVYQRADDIGVRCRCHAWYGPRAGP